jgi:hypothetical protein
MSKDISEAPQSGSDSNEASVNAAAAHARVALPRVTTLYGTIVLHGSEKPTDEQYAEIGRRANAYPRLVKALRDLLSAEAISRADMNEELTAEALLRELGEL